MAGICSRRGWIKGVLVSLMACASAASARGATDDLTPRLQPIRERAGLPAMAAVVVHGDQVVALGADGLRRAGGAEKVTVNDRWHIGSNTKSMTATLCAMLVEEGKLTWDTTIGDVFPELKDQMHPRWRTVTLEQLLTNRGGMPHDITKELLWAKLWQFAGTPEQARGLLLRGVTVREPEAEPGTKYIYSNAGFAVAGHMAERVSNKSWEELLRERLFEPLKMDGAGFGAPGRTDVVDEPRGHTAWGAAREPGVNADNPVAIGPAGIVHCPMTDYAHYLALHLRGERDGGGEGAAQLLKPETFKKLHAAGAAQDYYAMGWAVVPNLPGAGRALTHNGSNTLWYITAWVLPDHDLAVAVACNQGGEKAARTCQAAAQELIRAYLERGR